MENNDEEKINDITMSPAPETKKPRELSTPFAIVIGAVIIALAIIVVKMPARNAGTGNDQNDLVQLVLGTKNVVAYADVAPKDTDHIRGEINAKTVIVEYSDFECPFCKVFHETMKKVIETPNTSWIYRHYPLDMHPKAPNEALASECASAQGKDNFWKFADQIFKITPSNNKLDPVELENTAKGLNLDMTAWNKCMTDQTYANIVSAETENAVAIGAHGTPYSILIDKNKNTYKIEGAYPYEIVKAVIEKVSK